MSAILALSAMRYTNMKNNAIMNMMNINNSRMSMLSNPSFMGGTNSLGALCAMDTQMEMDSLTYGVQYQMAKAMLEQIKKLQKEELKNFDMFA